ncbi:MAG: OmpH family outer membrane protein [Verrucomicrobiales bacterium]|nr:OmpH family outer membrane protein [Verrucomicrobiales bacterium]
MKRSFFSTILSLGLLLGGASSQMASAQGINIGVVDMQECLNQFYKTKLEVEQVNAIAKEKQTEIDAKRADYEALTKKLTDLDKRARDTALGNEQRQAAVNELQAIMQERMAKGREIDEAQRRAQQEIVDARQKMEQTLVADIRVVVDAQAAASGLDLVFDKSFLPKANKVILVTSAKVPDLTGSIIAELNKNAPAGAVSDPPAAPKGGN